MFGQIGIYRYACYVRTNIIWLLPRGGSREAGGGDCVHIGLSFITFRRILLQSLRASSLSEGALDACEHTYITVGRGLAPAARKDQNL